MMTRTSGSSLVKWPVWLLFACVAVSLVRSGDVAAQVVATKPQLDKNQAGFYRLKVGRVEVTALSDGTMTWDALGQLDQYLTRSRAPVTGCVLSKVSAHRVGERLSHPTGRALALG